MIRLPNWDVNLSLWAQQQAGKPYDWGRSDCGSLVRRAHRIMFGHDVFGIPAYSTKREALSIYQKFGGVDLVMRSAGAVEIARNFVQQGDVFVGPDKDHDLPYCAIVIGRELLTASLNTGVVLLPFETAEEGVFLRVPHG